MAIRTYLSAAAAVCALSVGVGAAAPANAALVLSDLACSNTDISPTASDCSGWFEGNLLNNASVQDQIDALALIGFNWDGDWAEVDLTKVDATNDDEFDFAGVLDGLTYIGIHKGQAGQTGVEGTAFFELTADNLDIVTLNLGGASSAVVYLTGDDGGGGGNVIPEPATWAMMIMGFGGVGAMMRRRRPSSVPA